MGSHRGRETAWAAGRPSGCPGPRREESTNTCMTAGVYNGETRLRQRFDERPTVRVRWFPHPFRKEREKDGAPRNIILGCAGDSIRCRARLNVADRHALLKPGLRLAVGFRAGRIRWPCCALWLRRSGELGLVLHAAHLHHGLRGEEADGDLDFARALAGEAGPALSRSAGGYGREAQADRRRARRRDD